jgi:hypothetical protein
VKQIITTVLLFLGFLCAVALADRVVMRLQFVSHWFGGFDETDSPQERSNLGLRTDFGTGCQYLESSFGGLTPRLGADGRQICRQVAR